MSGRPGEPTLGDVLAAVEQVGHRLTSVEARLGAVEALMGSVEKRMLAVEGNVSELAARVQTVETTVNEFRLVLGTALQHLADIKDHLGIHVPKPVSSSRLRLT